ncbi:hypothetical protein AAY473_014749 [Plecturocebus cupreus]
MQPIEEAHLAECGGSHFGRSRSSRCTVYQIRMSAGPPIPYALAQAGAQCNLLYFSFSFKPYSQHKIVAGEVVAPAVVMVREEDNNVYRALAMCQRYTKCCTSIIAFTPNSLRGKCHTISILQMRKLRIQKCSHAQWLALVIPTLGEAKEGRSLEVEFENSLANMEEGETRARAVTALNSSREADMATRRGPLTDNLQLAPVTEDTLSQLILKWCLLLKKLSNPK